MSKVEEDLDKLKPHMKDYPRLSVWRWVHLDEHGYKIDGPIFVAGYTFKEAMEALSHEAKGFTTWDGCTTSVEWWGFAKDNEKPGHLRGGVAD